jgi:hypothetical protein
MLSRTACCQDPVTLANTTSPFSRIFVLGFYDGPTSGVLQCATCLAEYKFDMLDWSDDQETRVFRLASLRAGSLAQCVDALAQAGPPRWPVWVPARSNLRSEEAREQADRTIRDILARAEPAQLIVAWTGYGDRILTAQRLPAKELNEVPDWFSLADPALERDWFRVLRLTKNQKDQQVFTGDS